LDCLAEEAAKKRKTLLEELRALLELACRFNQDNVEGSVDSAGKRHR
jgi:hypothetical protein